MALPVLAQEHAPITRQLQALIEAHPEVGDLLTQSIAAAAKVNPDRATNPVQTLPEYYAFIVVASPADSVPQGVWPIDGQSRIQVDGGLRVKLARFFSIPTPLGLAAIRLSTQPKNVSGLYAALLLRAAGCANLTAVGCRRSAASTTAG
jgi:hypothetical protein